MVGAPLVRPVAPMQNRDAAAPSRRSRFAHWQASTMTMTINLCADIGEGFGTYSIGDDDGMLKVEAMAIEPALTRRRGSVRRGSMSSSGKSPRYGWPGEKPTM